MQSLILLLGAFSLALWIGLALIVWRLERRIARLESARRGKPLAKSRAAQKKDSRV
ncbi:hypothetical protein TPY_0613 [Sulfobacillus acidophilus TPY]|uniref:CcmD family protein n=1 Tax=Sulfobacillus acidophilus (strain ATCC 700253 / DSM 10332 / NAL) TaxID=679936 RepID=G8U0D9_SULAD|nr:hypothetical protein TPY_0613 [Sulfobacillus acidophilus TPY]AEW06481.1 hypothetical protein Sulac_3024 [Sulfobacillus acidophilus DSM 10332]